MGIKYLVGDTLGPNDSGIFTAGIHQEEAFTDLFGNANYRRHGNKIEVHAGTKEEAEKLRDVILQLLKDIITKS